MSSVWLVTHGSGEDGDEWGVEKIFFTKEAAEAYAARPGREVWDHPDVAEWPVVGSFLTEEEREAVEEAATRFDDAGWNDRALALRGLLARTRTTP